MILLLLEWDEEALRAAAVAAGAHGFLIKPLLADAVRESLTMLLAPVPSAAHAGIPPAGMAAVRPLEGVRVLVVEDNQINQEVTRGLLERVGVRVTLADDGRQALAMIQQEGAGCCDAILMDIQMPVMDGFEAAQRIRELPQTARLPIIGLTAHVQRSEVARIHAAGMDDHVGKPIDPELLLTTLARHLGREHAGVVPVLVGTAAAFPPVAGLDVAASVERMGGDFSLYMDLLSRFVPHHGQAFQEIAQALEQGERGAARRIAHTVKGAAGNLGLLAVEQAAARLEQCLAGADGDCAGLREELATALAQSARDIAVAWPGLKAALAAESTGA
ncbi:MAG: response regulator [Magnetococcus sp. WYHC-3]